MNVRRTIISVFAIFALGLGMRSAIAAAMPAPVDLVKILHAQRLWGAGDQGQGVRVGIISSGARNYATLEEQNILPPGISFFGSSPNQGDEGDWMMQVVHQIAPKAQLAFCPGGMPAQTVSCARALVDQFGANIVVDDINPQPVFYFPTPKAEGLAEIARDHPGVLFFTGAGNNGGGYYEGPWTPSPLALNGESYVAQNFGRSLGRGSNDYDSFFLPPLATGLVVLGTNANPNGGPYGCAVTNPQLTLALVDKQGRILSSTSSRCPVLHLHYRNPAPMPLRVRITVFISNGIQPPGFALKLVAIRTGEGVSPYALRFQTNGSAGNSSTFYGLMAVGAVDPNSGYRGQYIDEAFANSGPQCMDYAPTGTGRWSPLIKPLCVQQPVFVAPDRALVAFPAPTDTGYRLRPFLGDSAAGPAAAGVAALLLADHVPATQVEGIMERTAIPQTRGAGWDSHYGYGLLDADAAAVEAHVLPPSMSDPVDLISARQAAVFHPSPALLQQRQLMIQAQRGDGQSLAMLRRNAQDGQVDAQTWLAFYEHGVGDDSDAAHWALMAATQGQPVAQAFLGSMYNRGWGVPMDPRAAQAWWWRAARAGLPNALFNMGSMMAQGRGAVPNPVLAYALMRAAAERGLHFPPMHAAMANVQFRLDGQQVVEAKRLADQFASNPSTVPNP